MAHIVTLPERQTSRGLALLLRGLLGRNEPPEPVGQAVDIEVDGAVDQPRRPPTRA